MIKEISALAGLRAATGGQQLQLTERRGLGLWQVDAWADTDDAVCALLAEHTGLAAPAEPGAMASDDERRLLWAGPARYWYLAPRADTRAADLAARLPASQGHVLDLGHSRSVISLRGPAAERVLQSGLAVDLDPQAFAPGRAIFSAWQHHTPVTLWRLDQHHFELAVYRSYAVHTLEQLLQAGKPFDASLLRGD